MVLWYHLYLDVWRICISHKHYGFIFQKNCFLGTKWNAGGISCSKMYWKAKQSRHIENPLIFHCDRGCQYVSEAFHKATAGMIHSYSKKAYPWDNACIESFHALLKREWINRFKIFNYTHAYKLIFEYIETFYNTVRIHSHCGYLSPNEYEEQYLKNLETDVTNLAS